MNRILLGLFTLVYGFCYAQQENSNKESKSSIQETIQYDATDSIISFPGEQFIYLYNEAIVIFGDLELRAGYIEIDLATNLVFAKGIVDSNNVITQKPVFKQGGEEFMADSLRFNIETKKGKIHKLRTEESEGFIVGEEIKRLPSSDLFLKNGTFTTCNLDTPHFYIQTSKIKYTSDKKIVTGPAHLVLEGLHTPLFLPFGYYPIGNEKSVGIVLPTYGFNIRQGYSLNKLGFYVGISDYWDNKLTGTFYTNGSYILEDNFNYSKRYKYKGYISLKYARNIDTGIGSSNSTNYKIIWHHNQDRKAHPFGRLSANVDFGSSEFDFINENDLSTQLKNELSSSISYSRDFFNGFLKTTLTANHRQNTGTQIVNMTVPNLTVNTNTIYPFRSKKNPIKSKGQFWKDIRLTPTLNANSTIAAPDTAIFKRETWRDLKSRMDYTVPVSVSLNLSDKFSITPSLTYRGYAYFEKFNYAWNETQQKLDTSSTGGFHHLYDINTSISFGIHPTIYGMFPIDKGRVKAIRHVAKPFASWSYSPSQLLDNNRYYQYVQTDTSGTSRFLSQYGSEFTPGSPSLDNEQKWGSISFGINNNLEIKMKAKGDTTSTYKKVKIFEYLNFGSAYDIDADSLNFSNISFNTQSKLAKDFTINMNGALDPYRIQDGGRINEFSSSPELRRITVSLNFAIRSKDASKKLEEKVDNIDQSNLSVQDQIELERIKLNPNAYLDFNAPWSLNSSFSYVYSKSVAGNININKTLNFNGDVNLTNKWKITYSSGYDFDNKDFSTSSLGFVRDLHCWQMTFNWVPVGTIQRFNFTINVKASVLQDLKLTKKRDFFEF